MGRSKPVKDGKGRGKRELCGDYQHISSIITKENNTGRIRSKSHWREKRRARES